MIDKRRRPRTEEEKRKISETTKAAMQRSEIKEKLAKPRPNSSISKLGRKNPMYGKQVSEETRNKRRKAMGDKQTGEKNPAYKGDFAKPAAVHTWLRRRYPLIGICSECGRTGYTERAFLNWPKPYTRNPDDYSEMCRKCHVKYDISTGERENNY